MTSPKFTPKTIARFWAKVDKSPEHGGCWIWTAGKFNTGYGAFYVAQQNHGAHRLAWELVNGPIPDGLCVCHDCPNRSDNPACCNPSHCFLGTSADNLRDAAKKGRTAKGDRHGLRLHPERRARGERHGTRTHPEKILRGEGQPCSKLTDTKVREIRQSLAEKSATQKQLARQYGVSQRLIHNIFHRMAWSHIP